MSFIEQKLYLNRIVETTAHYSEKGISQASAESGWVPPQILVGMQSQNPSLRLCLTNMQGRSELNFLKSASYHEFK